ncbi:MAG: hypothetical protein K1X61_03920 [Chitinophagales bacterium]|nr:hypothetical protein [Chitinophagales bacterium]
MGNLIYIVVVIAYFIWQAQQARSRKQAQEDAQKKSGEQPGRKVREVLPPTVEERMRDIFREVEMKNKPYAQRDKTTERKVIAPSPQKASPVVAVKKEKKEPSPFLNFDMTQEEVAPEGTWAPMSEEKFSKIGYDYNKAVTESYTHKVNLRDAIIGKIILDRPEY